VIVGAVRWYLRYNLSYRDVEDLLVERGVEVDHVTVYRWVQRFTPLLADAARFARHSPGDRWFVDETYVKSTACGGTSTGRSTSTGRVIDLRGAARRDADAARSFFRRALSVLKVTPGEMVTDAAAVYPGVPDDLIPSAWHHVEQYANNPIEADHSQLKHRLRPMRGLRTDKHSTGDHRRTRLHPEPAPRTLRTQPRRPADHADRRRVYKTRPSDLTGRPGAGSTRPPIPQRNGAR
jgi:transposase-like protein